MPSLVIAIVGDAASYLRALTTSSRATTEFAGQVKNLSVSAEASARAQVAAAVKATTALKEQAAAYRSIAASAETGSAERIAATNLAASTEARLAASIGVTRGESERLRGSTAGMGRELEHATRGAISGSGAFHAFGRSLAFASGGFLAFEGVTRFLTDSIKVARDAEVADRSLAAQMKAGGESFDLSKKAIQQAELSLEKYGFTSEESAKALTVLDRGTGSITKAMQLQQGVADLARAKQISLADAANIVAKVFGGQETALRRAVPGLDKQLHGIDLVNAAFAKLSGQAAASTTDTERFAATLHDTERIVGEALLPTVNTYLESLSKWLQRSNETGATQRNIARAVTVLTTAVNALKTVLAPVANLFKALDDAIGSSTTALKLLTDAVLVWVGLKWASSLAATAGAMSKLTAATKEQTGAAEANQAANASAASRLGKAGVIGQTLLSSYVLTSIALQQTHLDKYLKDAGSAAYDFAGKLGIVSDKMDQFKGKIDPSSDLASVVRGEAERLSAAGDDMDAALKKLEALHPDVAVHDLQVYAGMLSGINPATNPFAQGPIVPPDLGPQERFKIPGQVSATTRFGASVEQRNAAFDAAISRQLGRVQDIASVQGQIGRLQQIAALIERRRAVTTDVTRRLKLEDDALEVFRQIKADRQQLAQDAIDAISLGVDRAALTTSLNDDIAAWEAVNAGLEQQQKTMGYTVDRQHAILANQATIQGLRQQQHDQAVAAAEKARQQAQEAAQKALAARNARQFAVLGLGPTGGELIPGVQALQRLTEHYRKAIEGTFLDTKKYRSMLSHIRTVLSEGIGHVSSDVRTAIKGMLDDIDQQLRNASSGPATRFRHVEASKILGALGLPADRSSVDILSAFGRGWTLPQPSRAFAAVGGGGVVITGDVHVHGVQDVNAFEDAMVKAGRGKAHQRRGAR